MVTRGEHEFGVGEMADGTIDTFPASELPRRMAELREMERAATEPDDLSDLSEIEALFGSKKKTDAEDAFNESDHPRAPDGRFGEKAGEHGEAKGGESKAYKPGVTAKGLDAAVALRKNVWQKEGPDSVEAIVAAAPKNQAKLAEVCEAVAGRTGLKFKNPGPKKEARIVEKLGRGKTPREVNDAVRGGFDVQTPDQADEIVKALAENFEVADEGWSTTPTGYFDRKVMVRFDDGMVGEVQVWPPGLLEIKSSKGHELYTEWQRTPPGPQKANLMKAQVALYAAAFGAMPHVWSQVVSAPSM